MIKRYRLLSVVLWTFAILIALLIVLVLLLNIPSVQNYVAQKFIQSVREKTGTELSIGSLKISFPRTVQLTDLFVKDQQADTLLYLHLFKANVELLDLFNNKVQVNKLEIENLVSTIHRSASQNQFNFQFILDAFSTNDTTLKIDTSGNQNAPLVFFVKELNLKNIRAAFNDEPAGVEARVDFDTLAASINDFGLDKQRIKLANFLMRNGSMHLVSSASKKEETIRAKDKSVEELKSRQDEKPGPAGYFPEWNIAVNQFELDNIDISYDDTEFQKLQGQFDPRHLAVSNLHTMIRQISISENGYSAEIKKMNLEESCGFNLRKLGVHFQLTDQLAEIKNLQMETSESNITAFTKLSFSSLNDLFSNPGNTEVAMDLKNTTMSTKEVLLFGPSLAADSFAGKFRNSSVAITAKADGKIDDLNIENLELTALNKTILKSHGRIKDVTHFSTFNFDVTIDALSAPLSDVYAFVDRKYFADFNLPESILLKGSAVGKIDSLHTNFNFTTSFGLIDANAFYKKQHYKNMDTISFNYKLKDIKAGVILQDSLLGKISISGNAAATIKSDSVIHGSASVTLNEVQYNSYAYKNIHIDSRIDDELISVTVLSNDTNMCFELSAKRDLYDAKRRYSARLNLSRLNLFPLNYSKNNVSISTNLNANLIYGGLNNSEATIHLANTMLMSDDKKIPVDSFDLKASTSLQSLNVQINSDPVDATLSGNVAFGNIKKTLQAAFEKYTGAANPIEIISGNNLSFRMNVHDTKGIIQFFEPKLESLEVNTIEGSYKSDNNELSMKMEIPKARYSTIKLDTLNLVLSGKEDKISLDLQLERLWYNKMRIENFRAKEQIVNGKILSKIAILDSSGENKYLFANELELTKDLFKIRFLREGLVLNGKTWNVEEGNELVKQKNEFSTREFVFKNETQSIGFIADVHQQKLVFTNFALSNLVDMVTFRDTGFSIRGNLEGEINFPTGGEQRLINADLKINQIYFHDTLAGDLLLSIKADTNKMDIDTRLENDQNKIQISGNIDHLSETPESDLHVVIDIKNLHRLERFSRGSLSEMQGKINADITIKGIATKPEINGYMQFDETIFKINKLNFLARIRDDKITVTSEGLHFDQFEIEDTLAKKLIVNGDLFFKNNYKNLGFNLKLNTNNFQPVNSTASDNPVFFGKLSLNTNIHLTGDLKSPKLDATIKIDSATNLTYALPGSELKLITSEGIVQFTDSSDAKDSVVVAKQVETIADSIISQVKGIRLLTNIEIDPGAQFTVNIDPKSGDYLTLSGKAKLDINSDGTGKQSINGIYEVKAGYYQLSFYDLIKKKFNIKPGSTIAWSGQPMDAELNITAEYIVRTSSVALVANETSSMSDAEKKIFNQRLPYEVKLNIRGFLAKPEISFNITLPNQYLSANPLVATKLASLNTEEMAPDLNKQVFALLVTGSFIAENPLATTGSSSNLASTAARNSVNGILSSQLNNMSSKYVSGVDLNFDLTSFEDYSGSSNETRTEMEVQVSKKMFNDRLTVEAQNSFNLSGNKKDHSGSTTQQEYGQFAVIYNVTETGEYKLRAYYQNAYDPFDGDITISGLSVIFEKEFDSLKWKKSNDTKAVDK